MSDRRPIGIFDSGIGGLTVVRQLKKCLPYEDIVYFGDTAHLPYGSKSKDTVLRFSIQNILFLLKKNVKLIVVACNTASSAVLGDIGQNFKIPVIGVISPGAAQAAGITKNQRIGVIGTRATIRSRAYARQIKKISKEIKIFSFSCPLFVPLVQEGWIKKTITYDIASVYLDPLAKKNIDTLILGCTHYPLLKPVIKSILGEKVCLIDSAQQVALEVKQILSDRGLAGPGRGRGRGRYYVSDEPENFKKIAAMFLGYGLKRVEKVCDV